MCVSAATVGVLSASSLCFLSFKKDVHGLVGVEQSIVGRMMTGPEPLQTIGTLLGEGAVVKTHACGIENTNLLESEGGMSGILFEEREVFVGQCPDVGREVAVVEPKVRVGEVVHNGVQRPAA